jgi:hypothetical protein
LGFEQQLDEFLHKQIINEKNFRRRERLEKGLGFGETEFLRNAWFPAVGHFNDLYPEWEVRDFSNGYRYLDFAFRPEDSKGALEIQGYGSHARDIEAWRFKDLCMRHSHLALDGWLVMPIAYLSITESPKLCQQLILSFIWRFASLPVPVELSWLESETLRFARRIFRPFTPLDLSSHLRISARYARIILHQLVDLNLLYVTSGQARNRTYQLKL